MHNGLHAQKGEHDNVGHVKARCTPIATATTSRKRRSVARNRRESGLTIDIEARIHKNIIELDEIDAALQALNSTGLIVSKIILFNRIEFRSSLQYDT